MSSVFKNVIWKKHKNFSGSNVNINPYFTFVIGVTLCYIKNVDLNKNVLNELFQFTLAQNIIIELKLIICITYSF